MSKDKFGENIKKAASTGIKKAASDYQSGKSLYKAELISVPKTK
jgi:hypothetical protein